MKKFLLTLIFSIVTLLNAQTFNVSTAQEFSDALNSASESQEDDTIILSAGTYLASDYIQFQYFTNETHNLTIKAASGLTKDDVIIDGAQKGRVLTLQNDNIVDGVEFVGLHTIENVTIQNGLTSSEGGGIYSSFPLVLRGVAVINNESSNNGGGIYLNGYFELYDSILSNNIISESSRFNNTAAGLFQKHLGSNLSYDSKIINSSVSGNIHEVTSSYARSGFVGGIYTATSGRSYNNPEGKVLIENSRFENNRALHIAVIKAKEIIMKDTIFKGNSTTSKIITTQVVDADNVTFDGNINNATYNVNSAYREAGITASNGIIKNSLFQNQDRGLSVSGSSYVSIYNSKFLNNDHNAVYGAKEIDSCEFINNTSKTSGTVILSQYIKNSIFINNINRDVNSDSFGGAIFANHSSTFIINSIFKGNTASKGAAVGGQSSPTFIANSVFIDNNPSVDEASVQINGLLINNIFKSTNRTEGEKDVKYLGNTYLYNNYLDLAFASNPDNYSIVQRNTYRPDNYVDGLTDEYKLDSSSELVDKGLNPTDILDLSSLYSVYNIDRDAQNENEKITWLREAFRKDAQAFARVAGSNIDLGAYEYGSSLTNPIINLVTVAGDLKDNTELTFDVHYTLAEGRTLESITFDFENDETFVSENTYTFVEPKTYIIKIKLIDSENDFTIATKTVVIVPRDFDDLTYEEKLKSVIKPEFYNQMITLIGEKKTEATSLGFADGKQYVLDNLGEFDLVTKVSRDSDVSLARTNGLSLGKQYVLDNLAEFELFTADQCVQDNTEKLKEYINRFYSLVLERTADTSGENYWVGVLKQGAKGGGDIAKDFFSSAEYINRGLSENEFLNICYRAFFNREADDGGKNHWLSLMASGSTKDDVLAGFIRSSEFVTLTESFGIRP